ncbi:MAG: hypothetical protein FJ303_05290 [Planctomycetes bacterium]|nr:hypothetical protein [Planctomycetota bacterium]
MKHLIWLVSIPIFVALAAAIGCDDHTKAKTSGTPKGGGGMNAMPAMGPGGGGGGPAAPAAPPGGAGGGGPAMPGGGPAPPPMP